MRLILGAGCAGLSLACALVEEGSREPIELIDRRLAYGNDRTWCFWAVEPLVPGVALARHRWHRWQLIGRDGALVEQRSDRYPYVQLAADAFYADALERLGGSSTVTFRLGERVQSITPRAGGLTDVRTSAGRLEVDGVIDAMGGAGPLAARRPEGAVELRQSFLGLELETDRPVFDPAVATLMDFRAPSGHPEDDPDGGLHFMYVLPTSPTRALVEHTTLGPRSVSPARRRGAIAQYLSEHWGADAFHVVREERGALPMTTRSFPVIGPGGVLAVGAAAGAVRPSSGYAYVRIQRHVRALAQTIVQGQPPPASVGRPRHAVLDQLFLRALAVDPPVFADQFLALARRTSGDTFARFMSDASSLRDDAAVMAALTRPGFLVPATASAVLRPVSAYG